MFDRFTHTASEITPAGLGRLLQTGPVRALLLGLVACGSLLYGRQAIEAVHPFSRGGGPLLSQLVIERDLSTLPDCRNDACTVETVAPTMSAATPVPVRWLPDPVVRHPWPTRLKYPGSFQDWDTYEWIARGVLREPEAAPVGWQLRLGSNLGGLRYEMVDVPAAGYLARLVFPDGSGVGPLGYESHSTDTPSRHAVKRRNQDALERWRRAGGGRGPDGRIDADAVAPDGVLEKSPLEVTVSPEGLEYQPVSMPMSVQLPSGMVGRVRSGDPATLLLEAPRGFTPPVEVNGRVIATRGDVAQWVADDTTYRWLNDYFSKTTGRTPASDRLTLRLRESLGGRAGQAVQVPVSAVVRRPGDATPAADEATVWVVAGGIAAPVHVRVGASDGDRVLVNEIRSPHSGPFRAADWSAFTPPQRAILYRQQASRLAGQSSPLLHADARVVSRPAATLRAGDALRSR